MGVHLTRIYTRTGDDGTSGLSDFSRVSKGDPRLIAEALAEPFPRPEAQLRVHPLPDGRVQLRWLGAAGKRVQVESAESPEGVFVEANGLPAQPLSEDRQAVELPAESASRYFRVKLVPETPARPGFDAGGGSR